MARLNSLRLAVASLLVVTLMGAAMAASQRSAAAMATAANTFLSGLSADQRAKVALPFDGEERLRWHFIPNETFPRKGLMIKEMNEAQRSLAHALLKTGLSQRGYMTVTGIISLEDILKATETGGKMARDREEYYFSVFGTPSAQGAWGWRVEGHHVSLRFTIVKGAMIASSPAFLGTNPAEVRDGPQKGLRLLANREDAGRALVEALDASQRQAAIFNAVAPTDIVTANKNDITPLDPPGIAATAMTGKQRDLLMQIIDAYAVDDGSRCGRRSRQEDPAGRRRQDYVCVGGCDRARPEALLPGAGADLPDRIRQHAEQRQPRALGLARLQRGFRAGLTEGTSKKCRSLSSDAELGVQTSSTLHS